MKGCLSALKLAERRSWRDPNADLQEVEEQPMGTISATLEQRLIRAYRLANAKVRCAKLTSAWSLMICVAHAGLLSWWKRFA